MHQVNSLFYLTNVPQLSLKSFFITFKKYLCVRDLETERSAPTKQQHNCAAAEKAEQEMCSLMYTRCLYQRQICMSQHRSNPSPFHFLAYAQFHCVHCLFRSRHALHSHAYGHQYACQLIWGWQIDSLNPSQCQFLIKVSHMIHIDSVVLQLNNTFKRPLSSCWLDLRPFHHSILASSFIYIKKKRLLSIQYTFFFLFVKRKLKKIYKSKERHFV